MKSNIIVEICDEDIITTPLFWACECDADYLRLKSVPECPRCHALADESPDADVAVVLKYADDLPQEEIQALIEGINQKAEESPFLFERLLNILAAAKGLDVDNDVLYQITAADALCTLSEMLQGEELKLEALVGSHFDQVMDNIRSHLSVEWDDAIRYLVLEFLHQVKALAFEEIS